MPSQMEELRKELASAKSDDIKAVVMSKMESLRVLAENAIRHAQKNISYSTREFPIETILQKYQEGLDSDTNELFIPDYQRDYKWDDKTLSRFIESILLDFPIPYIYIANVSAEDAELDGRVEIIDGSQRIRALHYFVNGEVPLQDLKELKALEGFYFEDLPVGRKRRFLRETLRFVELKGDVSESHRRDLFERINSGMKKLVGAETRHGSEYASSEFYKRVIVPCSADKLFSDLAPLSDKKKSNGDHLELVTRFFGYLNDLESYNGKVLQFLEAFLAKSVDRGADFIAGDLAVFNNTMNFINAHFPTGFRRTPTSKTTPRARFEAIAVGVALALRDNPGLVEPATPVNEWMYQDEFQSVISADSANNKSQLLARIEFVRAKVAG
ncbi:hypothetical protein PMM47T1_03529 [Pseudomonas sp. M47T1]|uniref:DUF262 domain-containing protein n=1 Tax=Pseudomonas sp. M47T1 TaxID=1179778 RepID=UPI0002606E97|nr:DUF262 domain-containing protein [Pseudomonas sp. M47T1]EIK98303.1 hypothetical protein PMM47T1_03529 [Pseudomonas sp. M47T1]